MNNIQYLLSDEFVEFSTKIGEVHQKIKDLKTKFQTDMKNLRDEAEDLQKGFELWQNSQANKSSVEPVSKNTTQVKGSVPTDK